MRFCNFPVSGVVPPACPCLLSPACAPQQPRCDFANAPSGGSDCLHIDCTISCNGIGALPTICIQLRPGRPEIRSCAQPCPCRRHGTSISTDHHLDVDLIDAQAPDDRVLVCSETLSPMPPDDKRSARAPLCVAALRASLPARARNMLSRLRAFQRLLRKTTVPSHARATQRMSR